MMKVLGVGHGYKYFCLKCINEENMSLIKISEIEQNLHENMTWQRALDFYLQENAFLKTRLSQVLDNNTDRDFVALAEHFQNSFIHNDECIKDLQKDIIKTQRHLKDSAAGGRYDEKKIRQEHRKLQNEMGYFEKNFSALKNEFNRYLNSFL